MAEQKKLSVIDILSLISKSIGNGEIHEVRDLNAVQPLLNSLSGLSYTEDISFYSYFVDWTKKIEDEEEPALQTEPENAETSSMNQGEKSTELSSNIEIDLKQKYESKHF